MSTTCINTEARDLQQEFAKIKKTEGWHHTLDIINAEARKEELAAIWQGIERAMKRHKVILRLINTFKL